MSKNTQVPGHVTVGELRKGACSEQLKDAILTATERTKFTGKPSKVQLTLIIDKADDEAAEVEMVTITDEIKITLPKLPQKSTFYYLDPESGALTRENPQQFIPGTKAS